MSAPPPPPPDQFPPGYLEEDQSGSVIAAATTILVLTTVLFASRLWARSLTTANRGWDDHVLIPAYIFLIGLITCLYVDVRIAGLGRHTAAVVMEDPGKVETFLLLLYALDWFYVPSNMLSRVSVVILYLRIFTGRWERWACWAVMGFLIANCVATVIAAQLECSPLPFTWDKTIEGGSCFNQVLWYQLSNFPNVAGDVFIMALPIKTVWSLKASFARKAGIASVCLTGSIGLIASCVRTSIFYLKVDVIAEDPTFFHEAFTWTVIECGMYFSAACLIGMRPLLSRMPRWIKVRVLNASDNPGGSTFAASTRHNTAGRSETMSRLKRHYTNGYSEYSGIDGENGGRNTPPTPRVQQPSISSPLPRAYLALDDLTPNPPSKEITIHTDFNLQVARDGYERDNSTSRREFDRSYP